MRKKIFCVICVFMFVLTTLFPAGYAVAQEKVPFEKTPEGEVAIELVNFYSKYFTKYKGWENMPLEEKFVVVLNEAEAKVKDSVLSTVKDQVTDQLKAYAEKKMRLGLLQKKSGIMLNAVLIEGKSINSVWTRVDNEISQELAGKMKVLEGTLTAIDIGWTAYDTWQTKGPEAGMRAFGEGLADAVLDCMVPGWGTFRLAQTAVIALCEFIMQYSFDVALDAKIKGMFPEMTSNPRAFAEWLEDCSASDIERRVADDWELVGHQGMWAGRGTDSGYAKMKDAIVREVMQMRRAALDRKKEQERIVAEIEQRIDSAGAEVQNAEEAFKNTIESTIAQVEPELEKLNKYKAEIVKRQKEELLKREQENQEAFAEVEAELEKAIKIQYTPINVDKYVDMVEEAYLYIKERPNNGYSHDEYQQAMMRAYMFKRQDIERAKEANEKAWKDATDAFNKKWQAILGPLWQRYDAAKSKEKSALSKEIEKQQIARDAESARLFMNSNAKMSAQINLMTIRHDLIRGEAVLRAEAATRITEETMRGLSRDVTQINQSIEQGQQALATQYLELLNFPNYYTQKYPEKLMNQSIPLFLTGFSHIDTTGKIPNASIGSYVAAYEEALRLREDITADLAIVPAALAFERQFYATAAADGRAVRNTFESSFVEDLREPLNMAEVERASAGIRQYGLKDGYGAQLVFSVRAPNTFLDGGQTFSTPALLFPPEIADLYASSPRSHIMKQFKYVKKVADDAVSTLSHYENKDRYARSIVSVGKGLTIGLKDIVFSLSEKNEKQYAIVRFLRKDGQPITSDTAISESDGAAYLKLLKASWEQYRDKIEIMKKLKRVYGKGIKYDQGDKPETYLAYVDNWAQIPEKITLWETARDEAEEVLQEQLELAEKQKKDLEERILAAQSEKHPPEKVELLKALVRELTIRVEAYNSTKVNPFTLDEYKNMLTEHKELLANAEKELKAYFEETNTRAQRGGVVSLGDVKAYEGGQVIEWWMPRIYDVRVNTKALVGVSGDVVLTNESLINGEITISASVEGYEHLGKMLISVNGGSTWEEIPKQGRVNYSFTPTAERRYEIILRADRADTGQKIKIALIPKGTFLVYRNVDYVTMVLNAVQMLSDSYEAQDVAAFSRLVARDYLGNKTFLEEGVRFDFDMFVDIRLSIYVNRIENRKGMYIAETRWDKIQVPRQTGEQQRTTGNTTMMFVLEDGIMKIKNLRGNLLYATLSPEIAEASGLKQSVVEAIRTAREDRNPTQPGAGEIEDSGGVTSSGGSSATLSTQTVSVDSDSGNPGESFDFETQGWVEVAFPPAAYDIMFEGDQFFEQNAAQYQAVGTAFSATTEAPTAGYGALPGGPVTVGQVYVFVSSEGNYGKFEVTSKTDIGGGVYRYNFKFAVQTDGTRNIST